MKEIPLTQGKVALVDDEDYERVACHRWTTAKRLHHHYYAAAWIKVDSKSFMILLHRFILNTETDLDIDHIDGNGLNNQKANLRLATHSQNMCNRSKQSNNHSGYKGVWWDKSRQLWTSQIQANRKRIFIGRFQSIEDAIAARCLAEIEHHKEFVPRP